MAGYQERFLWLEDSAGEENFLELGFRRWGCGDRQRRCTAEAGLLCADERGQRFVGRELQELMAATPVQLSPLGIRERIFDGRRITGTHLGDSMLYIGK